MQKIISQNVSKKGIYLDAEFINIRLGTTALIILALRKQEEINYNHKNQCCIQIIAIINEVYFEIRF
jgi:hypothetical protein